MLAQELHLGQQRRRASYAWQPHDILQLARAASALHARGLAADRAVAAAGAAATTATATAAVTDWPMLQLVLPLPPAVERQVLVAELLRLRCVCQRRALTLRASLFMPQRDIATMFKVRMRNLG